MSNHRLLRNEVREKTSAVWAAWDTLSLTLIALGTDLEPFASVFTHAASPDVDPTSSSQQADFSVVVVMGGDALAAIRRFPLNTN
jgi:hypothetical protein